MTLTLMNVEDNGSTAHIPRTSLCRQNVYFISLAAVQICVLVRVSSTGGSDNEELLN